ncbi:snaclec B9 [Lampris incognitus]|uniref:snaclec B9 n=1 Tax=Lampris incognitus TaxID=2546036 RepID=UPI0024B5B942|nr:snaclec B9 [Lampris incognitus]
MYIQFCRGYGLDKKSPDEARAKLSPESKLSVELKDQKDERYPRSAHVYHAACAALGLICLVLLLVVIILGVKLSAQPEACSQERRVEEKAQRCSFESCKAQFPALPQTPTCQKCAKGWLTFSTSCYYLSKYKKSWEDSRSFCKTNGADLADITNQQVQTFLTGKGLTMYWIGLRKSGGSWSWVNNTTLGDSYWAEDGLDGDCGALHVESPPKKNWSKRPCSHLSYFICQKQP